MQNSPKPTDPFSFLSNSPQTFSVKSMKSPEVSQISHISNKKSPFISKPVFISEFSENNEFENFGKTSIFFENCEVLNHNSALDLSELNRGFIENLENSENEEKIDKFLLFKNGFEELLNKCEYYQCQDMKIRIDNFLKHRNSSKNKENENFENHNSKSVYSQKTQNCDNEKKSYYFGFFSKKK